MKDSSLGFSLKVVDLDFKMGDVKFDEWQKVRDLYSWIKKRDMDIRLKHTDMTFSIKALTSHKIQEINQDDVYEMYLHYDKIFKAEDEDNKIRLRYLKYEFITSLFT
jgi:hypothetical protein